MALVNSKCYYCNRPVQVDSEKDAWICPECGEPFIVEKSIRLSRNEKIKPSRYRTGGRLVRIVVRQHPGHAVQYGRDCLYLPAHRHHHLGHL